MNVSVFRRSAYAGLLPDWDAMGLHRYNSVLPVLRAQTGAQNHGEQETLQSGPNHAAIRPGTDSNVRIRILQGKLNRARNSIHLRKKK